MIMLGFLLFVTTFPTSADVFKVWEGSQRWFKVQIPLDRSKFFKILGFPKSDDDFKVWGEPQR